MISVYDYYIGIFLEVYMYNECLDPLCIAALALFFSYFDYSFNQVLSAKTKMGGYDKIYADAGSSFVLFGLQFCKY